MALIRRPEVLAWAGLLVLALVLRLVGLGDRAYHHDESQVAFFSWQFAEQGSYAYNPLLHGPWSYLATAASFELFGSSDFTARLPAALAGVGLVALCLGLRSPLGRVAALVAGVVLTVDPSVLYFTRFAREDAHFALFTFAFLVVLARWVTAPRPWHLTVMFLMLALAFTVKESTLIFGFCVLMAAIPLLVGSLLGGLRERVSRRAALGAAAVLAVEVVLLALIASAGTDFGAGIFNALAAGTLVLAGLSIVVLLSEKARSFALLRHLSPKGRDGWGRTGGALAVGLLGFFAILLSTFSIGDGEYDGLGGWIRGFDYWLNQHEVARGGEPWFFYGQVLAATEWPVVLLALAGVASLLVRPTVVGLFVLQYALASLCTYSWAGEKFAWLVVHPLLPLVLLAGIGVQWLGGLALAAERPRLKWALVPAAVLAAGYLVLASVWANAVRPVDPREILVSTQSSDQVAQVARGLKALDRDLKRTQDRGARIAVDASEGASFPWAWYLRDAEDGYYDLRSVALPAESDALVLTDTTRAQLLPQLEGYEGRKFDFRVWWVRRTEGSPLGDPVLGSPGDWAKYLTKRETFTPQGGMPEWVYVRKGLPRGEQLLAGLSRG